MLSAVAATAVLHVQLVLMQPKEIGLPITAYTAIDEVREVSVYEWRRSGRSCFDPRLGPQSTQHMHLWQALITKL